MSRFLRRAGAAFCIAAALFAEFADRPCRNEDGPDRLCHSRSTRKAEPRRVEEGARRVHCGDQSRFRFRGPEDRRRVGSRSKRFDGLDLQSCDLSLGRRGQARQIRHGRHAGSAEKVQSTGRKGSTWRPDAPFLKRKIGTKANPVSVNWIITLENADKRAECYRLVHNGVILEGLEVDK